jgi:serine/threonine protein kinase/formylglycine-generating enzyme required for sulfatase activity
MSVQQAWSPPTEFDEYRLVRWVGGGGMGEVYLAHDKLLDRAVAVKFIGALEPDSLARERFLVEARATARLQHPNVVTIYRVGEIARRPYIISEFVRGKSLDEIVKPIAWQRVLDLALGLARGLAAAHRRGVLHRDIKPANAIIAEDGQVKLLDFGLAKLLGTVSAQAVRVDSGAWDDPTHEARLAVKSATRAPDATEQDPIDLGRLLGDAAPGTSANGGLSAGAGADTGAGAHVASGGNGGASGGASGGARSPAISHHPVAFARTIAPSDRGGGALAMPSGTQTIQELPIEAVGSLLGSPEAPPSRRDSPASSVVGTPYYMSPEIWRGEPATRRSDVYSLGALLYELAAGHPPNDDLTIDRLAGAIQSRDVPSLGQVATSVDPRFAAIVDRCLLRDPGRRFASGDELLQALEALAPRQLTPPVDLPEGNPYRGLEAFEAEHRALFFGRATEIRTIVERLRTEAFVLIAGDSGIGKSSICRAGILPLIEEGALGRERSWSIVTLMPGKRPLSRLVAALAPSLETDEETLAARVTDESTGVGYELRRRQGRDSGLVIVIDQLEELVTLSDPEQARAFAELIGRFITPSPGVRVIGTVRGDFLTRLASLPGFGEEIGRALYLLRPLSKEGMREAITGPAQAKSYRFESEELVEGLIDSTARAEGGLPLLQFALAELWEARDELRRVIPSSALASIGGVAGALARHADEVLASMPEAQRAAARRILVQLVTADGTRARRTEAELVAGREAKLALEALVRGRLLVARESEEGAAYEVAHEALIQGWATLREWLEETASTRAVRERLAAAAAEWERLGRKGALWTARQLMEVESVDARDLPAREQSFLVESRRAVRRKRLTVQAFAVGIPLIVIGVRTSVKYGEQHARDVVVNTLLRDARKDLELGRQANAFFIELRAKAFSQFDRREKKSGDEVWKQALEEGQKAAKAYASASQWLERAALQDSARKDVKKLLADVLFERATIAERDHSASLEELLARLDNYDHDRRKLWDSPATLLVQTDPPNSEIRVFQYTLDSGHTRVPTPYMAPMQSPCRLQLPPGSFLIEASHGERTTVLYPVFLGRTESTEIHVRLPMIREVPEGFAYIPAGRFLFGTAGDEAMRQWLTTTPIHHSWTRSYYIARHETTYSEWLSYLETLPPAERRQRMPFSSSINRGALSLTKMGSFWQLSLRPTTRTYVAREGESIHYEMRRTRAIQDWLRFPVSGISFEDAQAYVSWLDRSKRLKGARLCTEQEWERAARGADDREFPNGDSLSPDDANFDVTYGQEPFAFGPDEVGSHPASRSPFGVDDMAGNVWEWTLSSIDEKKQAVRGGDFYDNMRTNRSTNREEPEPTIRDAMLGLRVCVSSSP